MYGSTKWIHFTLFIFLSLAVCAISSAQKNYRVLFYNVENLFDPFNDPLTNDDDYTPAGTYHWTRLLFREKINKIYKAIISGCNGDFPDIIGLAEIENQWVLEQLISQTPLVQVPYGIIHKESPDIRGIDVALLYRKDRISPVTFDFFGVSGKEKGAFTSRDILYFKGMLEGVKVHFFVNHWPSRSEGYLESKEKRIIAATILKLKIDSLFSKEMNPNILIMGDFNATPKEGSLLKILRASLNQKNKNDLLVNLSSGWMKRKKGTIYRTGQWEIFDQFICSKSLVNGNYLSIVPDDTKICFLPFLLEKDEKYLKMKPFRTYLGPIYHGGISDHLPIVTVLQSK